MEIVVTTKLVGEEKVLSTYEFEIKENKPTLVASRKVEYMKRGLFGGRKLVMCSLSLLEITPQNINKEGFSFTFKSEFKISPSGKFTMIKNPKKGDVYVLGVGESITFTTQDNNPNEEYIISIKENK